MYAYTHLQTKTDIDFSYYRELAFEDQEFYFGLIQQTSRCFANLKNEYTDALLDNKHTDLRELLHKIKPTIKGLKIVALDDYFEEAKLLTNQNDTWNMDAALTNIRNVCTIIGELINALDKELFLEKQLTNKK